MKVLVAYGSKMGGTAEISHAIGDRLEQHEIEVELAAAGEVEDPAVYDGIVVGSSLYTGRWRGDCVRLLKRMAKRGYGGPVWLFHSGPLGDDAEVEQAFPKKVLEPAHDLDVRDWATFGGVLEEHPSGVVAKLMAHEMAGDWRDWDKIVAWADAIAVTVQNEKAA